MAKYIIRKERATGMGIRDLFKMKGQKQLWDEEYPGGKMFGLSGYYGNDREGLKYGGENLTTKNLFGLGSAARRFRKTHWTNCPTTDYHNSPFFETQRVPVVAPVETAELGAFFETQMVPRVQHTPTAVEGDPRFFEGRRASSPTQTVVMERARRGQTFETQRTRPDISQEPIMFGGLGTCGWYGNEPEAKLAGGGNLHTKNLFGFGNVEEETIDYLGTGHTQNNMLGIGLGIAALYLLTR